MKISLAFSHTPWIRERVESFDRLWQSLSPGIDPASKPRLVRTFAEREPNHVWSARMWSWAAHETDADWCLFLQDDVEVAPDFWTRLGALLGENAPSPIVGLESVHPAAMDLAREGSRWCATRDGLIGVGYVVRRDTLSNFLEWRSRLRRGAIEAISEDTLLGLYAARVSFVSHPIPTIIDHVPMASTYGNDHHKHRRPLVTWRDEAQLGEPVYGFTHLGRFYKSTAHLLRAWDPTFTAEGFDRIEGDVCPERWRKWL